MSAAFCGSCDGRRARICLPGSRAIHIYYVPSDRFVICRRTSLGRSLEAQFAEKKTEPNSGLGKAITYLLRHWKGLTAFLRHAGAPLDNNICEQALKRAVLHRKNALFHKTLNGAQVGDLFMSLIHTCQLTAGPTRSIT